MWKDETGERIRIRGRAIRGYKGFGVGGLMVRSVRRGMIGRRVAAGSVE